MLQTGHLHKITNKNVTITLEVRNSSKRILINTLLAYNVQLVMSSESIPPNKPKTAPEAPTEMFVWMKSADNTLPPNPEIAYSNPIRTVI